MDRQAHVIVIGIDLPEKDSGDAIEQVEITYQIANPQVGSAERGQAEREPSNEIITVLSSDVINGRKLVTSSVSRPLNFGHLKTVIIGEKLARSAHLHHVIAAAFNDVEIRREVDFFVSKERASEFIRKNKPKLETRPHKYYELIRKNWRGTGFVPDATFNRYFQHLQGELFLVIYATTTRNEKIDGNTNLIDNFLAGEVPQQSGDPVQILGSAVIKNGRMIGKLTGVETRMALLLRPDEQLDAMLDTVQDPLDDRYQITIRIIKNENTKVKLNLKKDPPDIEVTVPIKVRVITVPSLIDYVYNLENQKRLQNSIAKYMKKGFEEFIETMQKEFKSEAFQWHLIARKQFWTLDQYDQYDWLKKFENANVKVNVDVKIIRFGKQYKMPQIKSKLGDE